jgi:hypothetical protein
MTSAHAPPDNPLETIIYAAYRCISVTLHTESYPKIYQRVSGDIQMKMGNDSSLPCDTLPRGLLPANYISLRRILKEHNMRRPSYKINEYSLDDVC